MYLYRRRTSNPLPPSLGADLYIQAFPEVLSSLADGPWLLILLPSVLGLRLEVRYYANFRHGAEQILEDPSQPWTCEFDGWLRVDLKKADIKLVRRRRLPVVSDEKVDSEQLKNIRERLWITSAK